MRIVRLGMVVALLVTGVGLTVSTAAADQYLARRATSVKVLWRRPLKQQHPYRLRRDDRYSRHLRVRYARQRHWQDRVWLADAHQKVYDRYSHKTAIYDHLRDRQGKSGGWVWRGYLVPAPANR
ncbi:hypothetical protein [Levilactobacillus spicheri]|nr:hypothetical protein [Levilactobacillus spicheri]